MSAPAGSYSQMGPPNTANQAHFANPNVNQGGQFNPTSGAHQNTAHLSSEGRMMDSSGTANPNFDPNLSQGQNYNTGMDPNMSTGQNYNTNTVNSNLDPNLSTGQNYNANTTNPNVDPNLSTGQNYNTGTANSNVNQDFSTGQGYNQMPGRDHNYAPAEQSAQTGDGVASCGGTAGKGVHGVFKSIHGAGETLRGNAMAAIDNALGHKEGAAKNQQIAQAGYEEMRGGRTAARGPGNT